MAALWRRIAQGGLVYALAISSLLGTATLQEVMAQSNNNASCGANHEDWKAFGTNKSDVCGVARELMGTCGISSVHKLGGGLWYTAGEFHPKALDCTCTEAMYNLLTVCAACQKWSKQIALTEDSWPSLDSYQAGFCFGHSQNNTVFQNTEGGWAFELDDAQFNLTKALSMVQLAGSESTDANSTDANGTSTIAASPSSVATAAPPTITGNPKSGPNIGVIVGAVVGCLVFLGAIGLGFWLFHRRRRAHDVAPSAEFLKPEYYVTPPLLSRGHDRRDSDYHDDIEEEAEPAPTTRRSWAPGIVTNRAREEDDGDMLPPFTQGTYIGPSPHEKDVQERRGTGDTDFTMRSNTTTTHLLTSSPTRQSISGPSGHFS